MKNSDKFFQVFRSNSDLLMKPAIHTSSKRKDGHSFVGKCMAIANYNDNEISFICLTMFLLSDSIDIVNLM